MPTRRPPEKPMRKKTQIKRLIFVIVLLTPLIGAAQTTEFTYQGKLLDSAMPANANYDFEFRLFGTGAGGAAIATQTRSGVSVSNGIFTVQLDFGGQFDGTSRWLEIAVKPAGSPNPLTVLIPRQAITSTPHSIRALSAARADLTTNSLQLGGLNAGQYVVTTDTRLTDARNPLANSANYIQNTASQQTSSDFNVSGNGRAGGSLTANVVQATSQFNLAGERVMSNPGTGNFFAGSFAGLSNTSGSNNSFFGRSAGSNNTAGSRNSFFGNNAGSSSTTFNDNAFFGHQSGLNNIASNNSFFGSNAGSENTVGNENSFFGAAAGAATIGGDDNSFFGRNAGSANTEGNSNTFFGYQAGNSNATGSSNTVIGTNADVGATNLNFATAIGAGSVVNTNNTIALGRSDASDTVRVFGGMVVGGDIAALNRISVSVLGAAGSINLCWNSFVQIATCSSSLRYKTSVQAFNGGLDLVRRLRPISFTWRDGGMQDVGFGAEEVEKVEPLLVTYNAGGEIEGVKYGQMSAVLVNSIQQQQQIIEQQQRQIDALKKLVCLTHAQAEVCK